MKQTIMTIMCCLFILSCNTPQPSNAIKLDITPTLYPSISDITIPTGIAPVQFQVQDAAEHIYIEAGNINSNTPIVSKHLKDGNSNWSSKEWQALISACKNDSLQLRFYISNHDGWKQLNDIQLFVSDAPIDPVLVYRKIYPGYELWSKMGIYQRELCSYDESVVLDNSASKGSCVNCHSFAKNDPQTMMLHLRGNKSGTFIRHNGQEAVRKLQTALSPYNATYPNWHPSGQYIAFSHNDVNQYFHAHGDKPVEVADAASDILIYDVTNNRFLENSPLIGEGMMETFPGWSADGKQLYFCATNTPEKGTLLSDIKYDLYACDFDASTGTLSDKRLIYEASANDKSIAFPRCSPCGNFLLITRSDYGTFPIWHKESDLCIIDLRNNHMRVMDEVNSDNVDSYHSWSSNGNWIVFSSKREDGLWARPYIAYFDQATGYAHKPFVLPQSNPCAYLDELNSYNIPEFATSKIDQATIRTLFTE